MKQENKLKTPAGKAKVNKNNIATLKIKRLDLK